jgi:DHA1 family bicyclomycin/chloramphenicol resistance-like MFS transporter
LPRVTSPDPAPPIARPPLSRTTLLGIGIGTTIGQDYNGTLLPFATGFLLCTLAALAVVLVTEKGRMFRPHHHPI